MLVFAVVVVLEAGNAVKATNASTVYLANASTAFLGRCCEPVPTLARLGPGFVLEPRAAWVRSNCTCLGDHSSIESSVLAGKHAHFHWAMTNGSLLGQFLTLRLVPCTGKPIILAKPAVLRDGQHMHQLFETVSSGADVGTHTATWPFPDINNTGVRGQPLDADILNNTNVTVAYTHTKRVTDFVNHDRNFDDGDRAFAHATAARVYTENSMNSSEPVPWGTRAASGGIESTITFVVKSPGFFVSIYSEMDSEFTIFADIHSDAASNPVTLRSTGASAARRGSLKAEWGSEGGGALILRWNSIGGTQTDKFQIYMLKQPDGARADLFQGYGLCGTEGADLANGRDSRCNVWTTCGCRKNMIPIGGTINGYNAKMPGYTFTVSLPMLGLYLERDNRYLFTVIRTPKDLSFGEEVYLGVTARRNPQLSSEDIWWYIFMPIISIFALLLSTVAAIVCNRKILAKGMSVAFGRSDALRSLRKGKTEAQSARERAEMLDGTNEDLWRNGKKIDKKGKGKEKKGKLKKKQKSMFIDELDAPGDVKDKTEAVPKKKIESFI